MPVTPADLVGMARCWVMAPRNVAVGTRVESGRRRMRAGSSLDPRVDLGPKSNPLSQAKDSSN